MTGKLSSLLLAMSLALPVLADDAASQLQKGIQQVRDGAFQEAVVTLDGAVRQLAPAGNRHDLALAHLYLGSAYLGLKQNERAEAEVKEARRADASVAPDPNAFPPELIALYDKAQA